MMRLVSPDGVTPSRMVSVSASVNLSSHCKVHKFAFGTSSLGWSGKKGRKTVVVWCWCDEIGFIYQEYLSADKNCVQVMNFLHILLKTITRCLQ